MKNSGSIVDSKAVSEFISERGNLKFYWDTFKSDPKKIIMGIYDSVLEVLRWIVWPRFPVRMGPFKRLELLRRFVGAELAIPGATTLLEAIWLAYAAQISGSNSKNWVQVGCFKGLSATRLSLVGDILDKKLRVYDTFEGLPGNTSVYEAVDGGVNYEFMSGSYMGSQEEVRENIGKFGASHLVSLIKGDVRDTLPDEAIERISFAFLDVDLVESYESCFRGLAKNIEHGTILAIHEACYLPIRELVENGSFWKSIGCEAPSIEYIQEKFGIRSCRGLALLKW